MARPNVSQAVNQAVWGLVETLDIEGNYAEGMDITILVERIAKVVIRELPDDLKK